MAAVISMASAKGGVGKTSLTLGLATELALQGVRVAILDADLNQHSSSFGAKANIDGFEVIGEITEANVLAQIKAAQSFDLVIVDLPGGSSLLALKAMQRSHLVLIPTQMSLFDARDAMRTVAQVDDAGEPLERVIPRAVLWSRVPAGFESLAARKVREFIEEQGVPIFRSRMMQRAAMLEMVLTGRAVSQIDPGSKGAQDLLAIATEVMDRLQALAVAA